MNATVHDFEAPLLDGQPCQLGDYRGRVLLIVNTASRCGFTPQYEGLERIYRQYKSQGFEILGFPCNQFGAQEPGEARDIAQFCEQSYGVSFPMFAKVEVNGEGAHPLFRHLKKAAPGVLGSEGIKWNFTKFLVNRQGEVVQRYAPSTKPEQLAEEVAGLLGTP